MGYKEDGLSGREVNGHSGRSFPVAATFGTGQS
jgi:hypothetical protein